MSADFSLILVDTNILLAATDRSRKHHAAAIRFLTQDERKLAIAPQIVREYLAVATRPPQTNGLGLPMNDALSNVDEFLATMKLLTEDAKTTTRLLDLLADGGALGKQVHDANVVPVALAHDAGTIVTDNIRHFARFASLIAVEDLGEPARGQ